MDHQGRRKNAMSVFVWPSLEFKLGDSHYRFLGVSHSLQGFTQVKSLSLLECNFRAKTNEVKYGWRLPMVVLVYFVLALEFIPVHHQTKYLRWTR